MKKQLQKHQKPLLFVGLLGIGIILFLFRDKIASWFKPSPALPSSKQKETTSLQVDQDPILHKGSKGPLVKQLQLQLNEHHKKHTPTLTPLLEMDGIFGQKTERMLLKYTQVSSICLSQLSAKLQAQIHVFTPSFFIGSWRQLLLVVV